MIAAAAAALAAALYLGPLAPPSGAALADSVTITSFSKNPITADGADTTVVTAHVSSAGVAVDGETVTFAHSDPNERVSATTGIGSGDYQATITSSTTAGLVDITATDTTALPNQLTSQPATLTQVAGPAASVSVTATPTSIPADGATASTVKAAVIDAFSNPVEGDSVTFSSNFAGVSFAAASGATDVNGFYTTTVTGTKVGTATIKATDGGVSGATPLKLTAGPAANVSVSLSPASIVANGTSSTTATATVTDANGNPVTNDPVVFSSSDPGEVASGATPHPNGTYTATIRSSTSVGTPTITATDTSVKPNPSGHATLTQTAAGSTVVLSVSPTKAITNQPVALVATVQTTSGPPVGTVTFDAGGNPIAGCAGLPVTVTASIGTVTCTTSFAGGSPPGPLTAVFAPTGTSNLGATSAAVSLTLAAAPTTTTLGFPATTKLGAKANYSARVTTSEPGAVAVGGTVAFFDGRKPIKKCSAVSVVSGAAACTLTYSRSGPHTITAKFGGDANFTASNSPAGKTLVTAAPAVKHYVTSTMTWSFQAAKTYAEVISLIVSNPPRTGAIIISCSGAHGCPFGSRSLPVPSHTTCAKGRCTAQAAAVVNLTSQLRNHKLEVGSKLVIQITRKNYISKYYSFLIKSTGPQPFIGCLVPGQTTPDRGCTKH